MKRRQSVLLVMCLSVFTSLFASTDKYIIDVRHKHAYVQFKISHYGFSYVLGQFEEMKGAFCYNPDKPGKSRVEIAVDIASIDTGHAERDGHLRSTDYLNAEQFPVARFVSTRFEPTGANTAKLTGELNFHGVTREIVMETTRIGMGKDPWGQYRTGFEGSFEIDVADYGLQYYLGEKANRVEVYVIIEGVRSKYANIEC